jgi:hypothetical protein
LVEELSATDLQSLLIDLARARAQQVTPRRLVQRWREDRFTRPAAVDPRLRAETEAALWRLLPEQIVGLTLSPLSPLGSCSAVAPVDQNRIVSTARTSEVTSDPTNALALEAAVRRQQVRTPVHLAGCSRVVRAQRFDDPAASAHFELFALVSSGRDTGSGRAEADLLVTQLEFWQRVLAALLGEVGRLDLTFLDDQAVRDRWRDTVAPALPGLRVREWPERSSGRGYYQALAFKIMIETPAGVVEIGDGGFTNWTAQLLPDAKERCLISCVSTERLAAATATGAPSSSGAG